MTEKKPSIFDSAPTLGHIPSEVVAAELARTPHVGTLIVKSFIPLRRSTSSKK